MYIDLNIDTYLKENESVIDITKPSTYNKEIYRTDEFDCSNRLTISRNVAVWKNAYAIHKWFVENTFYPENCSTFDIDTKDFQILSHTIDAIINELHNIEFKLLVKYNDNVKLESFKFDSHNLELMYTLFKNNKIVVIDEDIKHYCIEMLPMFDGFNIIDDNYIYTIIKTKLMFDRIQTQINELEQKGIWYSLSYRAL